MQIIGGLKKGQKLKIPSKQKIRPTSQKVKAALFNILGQKLGGQKFLDLFAGSGGVGIEALSRGAEAAVFVEKDFLTTQIIRANLENTGLVKQAKVYQMPVRDFLKKKITPLEIFDFIFLDPPYESEDGLLIMQEIGENVILKKNVVVIFEHRDKINLPAESGNLEKFKENNYGDSSLTFYKLK